MMSEGLDVAECLASCFKARSRNPAREEARGATQSRLYEAREREREREPVRKRESERQGEKERERKREREERGSE